MMRRFVVIGISMAALLLQTAIAWAQQDLQGWIQDLVRQMITSMEQQQEENAERLGKVYGVDTIASASVTERSEAVEVNGRLIETETGRVFAVARTQFSRNKDVAALMGGSPVELVQPGSAGPTAAWAPIAGMVLIPAGPFIFGEKGKEQTISLPAFYMDLYEVTHAEYAKVHRHEYPPDKANHPVVSLYWHEAKSYCEAVGKRLPTEQEWEKAARGTDGRHYPWGDTYDPKKLNTEKRFSRTTPVGQFPEGKSPYGLFDMAGNAWEWTASEEGTGKVVRGGAWNLIPPYARATTRFWKSPYFWNNNVGVRCAKTP